MSGKASAKDGKRRPPCPLKHPRWYDRKHGLTEVGELFDNLRPKDWKEPPMPEPDA